MGHVLGSYWLQWKPSSVQGDLDVTVATNTLLIGRFPLVSLSFEVGLYFCS